MITEIQPKHDIIALLSLILIPIFTFTCVNMANDSFAEDSQVSLNHISHLILEAGFQLGQYRLIKIEPKMRHCLSGSSRAISDLTIGDTTFLTIIFIETYEHKRRTSHHPCHYSRQ